MVSENGMFRSPQEEDHLERSTKKIKATLISEESGPSGEQGKSFRDTLLESKIFKDCYHGSDLVEEPEVDSDDDMDEVTGDGIPSVTIDAHLKKELRDLWRLALIIKLLGKIVSFNVLMSRVTLMWKLTRDFELIDLGHGYYVVKFANLEDRSKVMTEGPWKIMDHYFTVQRWRPHFHPFSAIIGSTAVWIQLPEFPLEYFNVDILMEIGRLVGKPLKLDFNTTLVTRDKFACICIEVDLRKPLVLRVKVGRHIQRI